MCGILGFIASEQAGFSPEEKASAFNRLLILSASRGKEASGLAARTDDDILVCKLPLSPQRIVKQSQYKTTLREASHAKTFIAVGHSRLVTNGLKTTANNNQPVMKHGMTCVHNGIIVNAEELWTEVPSSRTCDVDSEIILSVLQSDLDSGEPLPTALRRTLPRLKGSASVAILFEDRPALALMTNTGSLYVLEDEARTFLAFASEEHILNEWIRQGALRGRASKTTHFKAGTCRLIGLPGLTCRTIEPDVEIPRETPRSIRDVSPASSGLVFKNALRTNPLTGVPRFAEQFQQCMERSGNLRRCRKCILPESMPMMAFDADGVCHYCRDYTAPAPEGLDALRRLLKPYRSSDDRPDCIVGFSGGRDSSYMLHVLKRELKMNPIAYTYDWGMVTDLARRNQARMCGALGIEHILVSADIDFKRDNIRQNVAAWLHRPRLGMIPLFMAGDKQYFTHAYQLKKQTGIPLLFIGESPYEKTDFKTGFCGLKEKGGQLSYALTSINKLRMMAFYGKEFIRNPRYLNSSLADTLSAFHAYYLAKRGYHNLYNYVAWDEAIIDQTLKSQYDWESAADTDSTWRIGDGTASFYNYIYFVMAGFSEHDTFRSNQIRAGLISREDALKAAQRENQPRYESIKWYCDTIGIDMERALQIVHAAPKVY